MNSSTLLSWFCAFFKFLPIFSVLWFILAGKRKISSLFLHTLLAAIVCYVVLVYYIVPATDADLLQKAKATVQGTPEYDKAWEEWGSDTGRRYADITGLFYCPLISAFWHLLIGVPYLLIMRLITRKKQSHASATD